MRIVTARGDLLETILDETYAIWHEGLSRKAYGQWNAAQMRTAWGARHLERVALVDDDGTLLSSAKRYRFRVRVDGRRLAMCGIGALFTPPDRRGRGFAGELIERILEQERAEGASLAALFSEIGPGFYERRGFTRVPVDEVTVGVEVKDGAPAMLVRAGTDNDLPALAFMHDQRSRAARFALEREPSMIQFAIAKKRMLAGLGPMGLRHVEFHVAEEGASAVAYAILSINANGWTLDEAGDRDPAGARLGALLQVLVAREPARKPPLIRAWWPRTFDVPPQLALSRRVDAPDVLMMRPLGDVEVPAAAPDVFYWRGDFF